MKWKEGVRRIAEVVRCIRPPQVTGGQAGLQLD